MKRGEHKGRPAPGDRGMYDYAKIVDTYGRDVVVRQSSSADAPRVWIFCTKDDKDCVFHLGEWQSCSPHLGVREAKMLRDALDQFINDQKEHAAGLAAHTTDMRLKVAEEALDNIAFADGDGEPVYRQDEMFEFARTAIAVIRSGATP